MKRKLVTFTFPNGARFNCQLANRWRISRPRRISRRSTFQSAQHRHEVNRGRRLMRIGGRMGRQRTAE